METVLERPVVSEIQNQSYVKELLFFQIISCWERILDVVGNRLGKTGRSAICPLCRVNLNPRTFMNSCDLPLSRRSLAGLLFDILFLSHDIVTSHFPISLSVHVMRYKTKGSSHFVWLIVAWTMRESMIHAVHIKNLYFRDLRFIYVNSSFWLGSDLELIISWTKLN